MSRFNLSFLPIFLADRRPAPDKMAANGVAAPEPGPDDDMRRELQDLQMQMNAVTDEVGTCSTL